MKNDRTEGQGLTFTTDPETGKVYPIPAGGSGNEAPIPNESEPTVDEGTVSEPPVQEVQSDEGSLPSEGQGFLEPYLREIPEDQRGVVEPILERYRQEQDANFNKRFEQIQEDTRIPVTIYQYLLEDPVQTMNWIAERIAEERGLDVRSQLLQQWNEAQQGQVPPNPEDPNQPLTQAQLDEILENREQDKLRQQQQQQFEQQQYQQQQKTINSWIDDATKKFSVPLDDANGEDPVRAIIIMQANSLHEQGVAKGKAAVEMATEAVAKRFGSAPKQSGSDKGQQPKVATGGSAPPGEGFDVGDPKQRKDRMMELFATPNQ